MLDAIIRAGTALITCGKEKSTGYLVARGLVLATYHGIYVAGEEPEVITVRFSETPLAPAIEFNAKVIDYDKEVDACLLSIEGSCERFAIPLAVGVPREGSRWFSYGYPLSRSSLAHRLEGSVSQVLPSPTAKLDLDLAVDAEFSLQKYAGLSGAPVGNAGASRGMVRLKIDGTLEAISVRALQPLLQRNGVPVHDLGGEQERKAEQYARRDEFQASFETHLLDNPGSYLFLEGAHGIGKTAFCTAFVPLRADLTLAGSYSVVPSDGSSNAFIRSQPEVFFDWLNTTIGTLLHGSPPRQERLRDFEMSERTEALLNSFSEHCQSRNQYGLIFVDGLNEIKDQGSNLLQRFLGLLPNTLPSQIGVVLTAPSHSPIATALSGRVKQGNILVLQPLPTTECEAYCWQELKEERADAVFIGNLCKKSKGHPLYLRYLIRHANECPEDSNLDDFPVLDGPIEEYYERIWEKLLGDPDALSLLGLIARLRPGLRTVEVSKALTVPERAMLRPTLSRIGHLLDISGQPAIYHPSFAHFLTAKTADDEVELQTRLGDFCAREPEIPYCLFNIIFHQLRGDTMSRSAAIAGCTQSWVDACVVQGMAPDVLLTDVRATLSTATHTAPPVETIRLLLLTQRVEFRYNSLFAQSVDAMATALVTLGRPDEALDHVIRYDSLITDRWSALRIANTLLAGGFSDHACVLLDHIRQNCREKIGTQKLTIREYLNTIRQHSHACLFFKLAGVETFIEEAHRVRDDAFDAISASLPHASSIEVGALLSEIDAIGFIHLLHFSGDHLSLVQIWDGAHESGAVISQILVNTLMGYGHLCQLMDLPHVPGRLGKLFRDMQMMLETGLECAAIRSPVVVNELIRFGAPHSLVLLADGNRITGGRAPSGSLRADNGVDADLMYLHGRVMYGRALGFLSTSDTLPTPPPLVGCAKTTWLGSIEALLHAFSFCDGRLRRASIEGDESMRAGAGEHCVKVLLPHLRFSLEQRVGWDRSYLLPEVLIQALYETLVETLWECFREGVPDFLHDLEERCSDQLGLYSEGYRAVIQSVVRVVQRAGSDPDWSPAIFRLLERWRDHVIGGVENRHELVPELLALIPAFIRAGAHEEGERLYQQLLRVSMGPSWYKEAQFGLMTTVLQQIPPEVSVGTRVKAVAACLERASGEMTFGRYVRYEKSILPGILFGRNSIRQGCDYYRRQTCGSLEQLFDEWTGHTFDAPTDRRGNRYVGGALEEQEAILGMVRNGKSVPWRLRWILLEVFQVGDRRHTEAFATELARIVNEIGIDAALLQTLANRLRYLMERELESEKFSCIFLSVLEPGYAPAFSVLDRYLSARYTETPFAEEDLNQDSPEPAEIPVVGDGDGGESGTERPDFYLPGLFGHQAALAEADALAGLAKQELSRGNRQVARKTLTRMLEAVQAGGWSIWGGVSSRVREGEELLTKLSTDSSDLVRAYSPLITQERYAAPWQVAEHLISRMNTLLQPEERGLMLDVVIEHCGLMVGSTEWAGAEFNFLEEAGEHQLSSAWEIFHLVLWLIDHPERRRRDYAAATVAWLLQADTSFDADAVPAAFGMTAGQAGDVLCGVFDTLSYSEPLAVWQRVRTHLDLDAVVQDTKHISRLMSLHAIADRAARLGVDDATIAAQSIHSRLVAEAIADASGQEAPEMPPWARSITNEWEALTYFGILTSESREAFIDEVKRLCAPLTIDDAWALHGALGESFRDYPGQVQCRWDALMRFALNCAVFDYVPVSSIDDVLSVLCIF